MNKVSLIILVLIFCLCVAVGIYFMLFRGNLIAKEQFEGKLVENGQQAIEIAKRYVEKKYKENFNGSDKYEIKVDGEGDVWVVWYSRKDGVDGGGGPELYINKFDGEVLECYLQK